MHRDQLLTQLASYKPDDDHQLTMKQQMITFIQANKNCFQRFNLAGHMTASVWVLHPDENKVLLMLHRKLQRWLQPGGHADGDSHMMGVAMKEAQEETGISDLDFVTQDIFDLDIHSIPAVKDIPAHLHYDVRYLLRAKQSAVVKNHESLDLRWFDAEDIVAGRADFDESIVRMAVKQAVRPA